MRGGIFDATEAAFSRFWCVFWATARSSSSIVCSNESKVCSHQLQHDKQEGLIQCWSNFWMMQVALLVLLLLSSGVNYLFWDTNVFLAKMELWGFLVDVWILFNCLTTTVVKCTQWLVKFMIIINNTQQRTAATRTLGASWERPEIRHQVDVEKKREKIHNQIEFWTALWQRTRGRLQYTGEAKAVFPKSLYCISVLRFECCAYLIRNIEEKHELCIISSNEICFKQV